MKNTKFHLIIAMAAFMLWGIFTSCKKEETNKAPAEGVMRIALLLDYEMGYGGYIYPAYNPYIFFKNGVVVKEPYIPVDEINTGNVSKDVGGNWGTWKQNGDKMDIVWHDGKTSEKDWPGNDTITAGSNEKIQGSFISISGNGNLSIGGDVGVLSSGRMSFTSDGWFTNEKVNGGGTSEVTSYSKLTTAGKYKIDGYKITLTFNNGVVKNLFFCFYGKDKKVFSIAGDSYSEG